jgi:hypothetical protein
MRNLKPSEGEMVSVIVEQRLVAAFCKYENGPGIPGNNNDT